MKQTTPSSDAPRFDELSIQGFRRLYDIRLHLRPLSVLIGANGTGKTSVLEVLSLLANSAQAKLSDFISDLGALNSVLTYDHAQELRLGISMTVPGYEPLEYSLTLEPQGIAYSIREEKLSQERGYPDPFLHIDSHGPDIIPSLELFEAK